MLRSRIPEAGRQPVFRSDFQGGVAVGIESQPPPRIERRTIAAVGSEGNAAGYLFFLRQLQPADDCSALAGPDVVDEFLFPGDLVQGLVIGRASARQGGATCQRSANPENEKSCVKTDRFHCDSWG